MSTKFRYEVARQHFTKTTRGQERSLLNRSEHRLKTPAEEAAKTLARAHPGKLIALIDHEKGTEREFIAKDGKVRELRW